MLCGGVSMPWSDVLTICGLFAVQCIYGLYMMFLDGLLAAGVPSLFVIVVACAASSVVVLPFAFALERKKWPKVWSPMLVLQLVVISLGGVSIYQVFMMLGVERTSPAIASAMPNLGPGFIFVIAACLRFERFNWKCKYTRAKDLGHTGVPQWGNVRELPEEFHSKCISEVHSWGRRTLRWQNQERMDTWVLLSSDRSHNLRLQHCHAALKRFPAPLSVCSITAMMGAIFSAIIQVLMEGKRGDRPVHDIPGVELRAQGACPRVHVQPVPDCVLGAYLSQNLLRAMDRPRMLSRDCAHVCRTLRGAVGEEQGGQNVHRADCAT
ncbi:hypothetical protein PVAP13_6KG068900 [Panicum virgatum]|uniref:WAT1-related protein n=1 Tax=Panicum virgatum TaxID=38727 RepID=A0A8T0R7E1_PANVG|nr:hypothetical protein PVAP13_6KG068900 [Panicum virgatum]